MNGSRLGLEVYEPSLPTFFRHGVRQTLPETPFRVTAADLDSDGIPELVAASRARPSPCSTQNEIPTEPTVISR